MSALDRHSVNGGNALVEITISVHPRVLVSYLTSRDGFIHQFSYAVITLLWIVLACVLQLSLSEYFPELPLYPLPLMGVYLSLRRSCWWALACAFACGIIVDALAFGIFGVTSAILAVLVVLTCILKCVLPELERHFYSCCYVAGISGVFVYVLLKLAVYFSMARDDGFVDLMPIHLLLAPILNGVLLAPFLYAFCDMIEWLCRLQTSNSKVQKAVEKTK